MRILVTGRFLGVQKNPYTDDEGNEQLSYRFQFLINDPYDSSSTEVFTVKCPSAFRDVPEDWGARFVPFQEDTFLFKASQGKYGDSISIDKEE